MEVNTPQNRENNSLPRRDFSAPREVSFVPIRLAGLGLFPGFPKLEVAFIAIELAIFLSLAVGFVHYYTHFAEIIGARIESGVIDNPAVLLAAPVQISVGQPATPEGLAERLRNGFYTEGTTGSEVGTFKRSAKSLEIHPGKASFFRHGDIWEGAAELEFCDGRIASITSLDDKSPLKTYWLEPEVITSLFGQARAKRRLVRYQELPKVMVDAILATEDHRFFSHHGVNLFRIVEAAITDIRADQRRQGGSTLTMQLARNVFLTPRRTIKRKVQEICLALLLETRLSKEKLLELYASQIYLGQRGSFAIYGVGEAAEAYFNKDVGSLTLPEAALIAGMIRGPNLYLPYQYPQRSIERRNFVLGRMVETGFIKPAQAEDAIAAPLVLAEPTIEARQEPFFVDMVREQLLAQLSERDLMSQGYRVYTTLDLDLQRAACEGTRVGLLELDRQVKHPKKAKKGKLGKGGSQEATPAQPYQPQLALVALDPHTGDVKALIGGRNYGDSQLNHALRRRQPGSAFKPFVYAAALNSAVDGSVPTITPATVLTDQPTAFQFGNQWDKPYMPGNYKHSYHGSVTVRESLMYSLNIPTVQLAETVGYDKVRNLALAAGFNSQLRPTPSIALGAYEATPLEVAGSYTVFANQGQYVPPRCIVEIDDAAGHAVWTNPVSPRRVLDPRVNYLMVSLLQSVISAGTGAGIRAHGFKLPAAGKTGTSHDGWFAGFTSNLLAVAWVGYDDNRELNLIGAHSALPLWAEFMKRAASQPAYRDAQPFKAPEGVVTALVEPGTVLLASAGSTSARKEIFVEGTEPVPPPPPDEQPGVLAALDPSVQTDAALSAPGEEQPQPSAVPEIASRIFTENENHAAPVAAAYRAPIIQQPQWTETEASANSRVQTQRLPRSQSERVVDLRREEYPDVPQHVQQRNPGSVGKSFMRVYEGEGSKIEMHLKPLR